LRWPENTTRNSAPRSCRRDKSGPGESLSGYLKPSKLPPRLRPVHNNALHAGPRWANLAELDEFVKLFLFALRDGLDLSIRKISHPTRKSKSPGLFSDLSSEEDALHYPADQDSRTNRQTLTRPAGRVSAQMHKIGNNYV